MGPDPLRVDPPQPPGVFERPEDPIRPDRPPSWRAGSPLDARSIPARRATDTGASDARRSRSSRPRGRACRRASPRAEPRATPRASSRSHGGPPGPGRVRGRCAGRQTCPGRSGNAARPVEPSDAARSDEGRPSPPPESAGSTRAGGRAPPVPHASPANSPQRATGIMGSVHRLGWRTATASPSRPPGSAPPRPPGDRALRCGKIRHQERPRLPAPRSREIGECR